MNFVEQNGNAVTLYEFFGEEGALPQWYTTFFDGSFGEALHLNF